jgi:tetratricopeptide (TPR) repeat protein
LALAATSARAHSDEAARLFKSGNSAFQAGKYAEALNAFEAALGAGLTGPAIHFNIGVSSFRLGSYARAKVAFAEVARTPAMAGLAYYNLGLVARQLNDSADAIRWFSKVEQATADASLRQLAASRLAELAAPSSDRNWLGYASFAAGYDDNVALISNSEVLGISGTEDLFAELQLAFSTPLDQPWRLDGGLALIDYRDLNAFDQLGLQGGGRYRWDFGQWQNDVGLQLGYTTLDGKGFETRRTLSMQAGTELPAGARVRARYRFHDISGLNEFSELSGQRHEASARITWTRDAWELGAELQFDVGDYDDNSLSARRRQLRFGVQRVFVTDWTLLCELSQLHSNYDAESVGAEDRTELALTLSKTLTALWRLVIRHAYSENDADQRAFDYRGNRISVGVEATI